MNSSNVTWLHGAGLVFLAGWIELLMAFPLLLLIYVYAPRQLQGSEWVVLVPAALFAGAWIGVWVQRLWMRWGLAAAAGAAAVYWLSPLEWPYPLIVGVLSAGLLLQGMTLYSRLFRPSVYWMGIALYFVSSWIYRLLPAMQESLTLLTWGGVVCLCIALYASNHAQLRLAALTAKDQPDRLPDALRRHNRLFSASVFLGAVLLAAVLGSAAGSAIWQAFSFVIRLLTGQPEPVIPEPVQQPEPVQEQFMPDADGGSGILGTIFDILFYLMLVALLIALAVLLLWWLFHRGPGVMRRLLEQVSAFLMRGQKAAVEAAYIDEESTLPASERMKGWLQRGLLGRVLYRAKEQKYEELTDNQARVRFLFRSWLRFNTAKGYGIKKFLTPKETVSDAAAWAAKASGKKDFVPSVDIETLSELYNQARYSNHPLSDDDVRKLKQQLDRFK